MIRQEGYNIIIEMEAPPRSIAQQRSIFYVPEKEPKTLQQRFIEVHREFSEEYDYKIYIENLKREIADYAREVFAKDIAQDITKEAVKCVNDVVKQTLR